MIEIHLNKTTEKKLNILAEKTKKTPIFHIKKAIAEYLKVHDLCEKDLFKDG